MDNEESVGVLQSLGVSEALARHALEVRVVCSVCSRLISLSQVHSGNIESAADFVRITCRLPCSCWSSDVGLHLAVFVSRRSPTSLTTKR